jgi:hypothetical protein
MAPGAEMDFGFINCKSHKEDIFILCCYPSHPLTLTKNQTMEDMCDAIDSSHPEPAL